MGDGGGIRNALKLTGITTVLLVLWVLFAYYGVRDAGLAAQEATATGDSIVVLGAAQYEGEPSPVLERRLLTALDLFESDAAPQVVTTGANQPGDTFTEGFAAFTYLRDAGVAEEAIVVVVDGGNTYESLLAAANQLDEDEREVIIVTDAYHAARSADIAAEVGLDATVIAAGDDMSPDRLLRETVAVSAGRLFSYRRISNWGSSATDVVEELEEANDETDETDETDEVEELNDDNTSEDDE